MTDAGFETYGVEYGPKAGIYFSSADQLRRVVEQLPGPRLSNPYVTGDRMIVGTGTKLIVADGEELEMFRRGDADEIQKWNWGDREPVEPISIELMQAKLARMTAALGGYTSDRDRALHEAYPDESYGLERVINRLGFGVATTAALREPEPEVETEADILAKAAAEAKRQRKAAKLMKMGAR